MIATGTDVKPIEALIFLRDVKAAQYFEQMKGRGARTIAPEKLREVTPDAEAKTRFVLIDAVGVTEGLKSVSQPLDRDRKIGFEKLIEQIAAGRRDEDAFATLAARLAALDRRIGDRDRARIAKQAGVDLAGLAAKLLDAVDPGQGRRSGGACSRTSISTPCCGCRPASSTSRASRRRCCSSTRRRRRKRPRPRRCGSKTCAPTSCFALKERPMTRADLDDFVACYRSGAVFQRAETERFCKSPLEALMAREKLNLDVFWLKDDTLDDPDLLPPPDEVAAEVVESLEGGAGELSLAGGGAARSLKAFTRTTSSATFSGKVVYPLSSRVRAQGGEGKQLLPLRPALL